jgi:nitroreductase
MNKQKILKSLNWRYATQVFDQKKRLSESDLKFILESARLSASSYGIEPWKFLIIKNKAIRDKMKQAGYNQSKFTEASHIVVIARRTDAENLSKELIDRTAKTRKQKPEELAGLKTMVDGSVASWLSLGAIDKWLSCQTYIALGTILTVSAMIGVDAGPMEGFDSGEINKILELDKKNLSVCTIVALGYRGNDPRSKSKKVRRAYKDVVETIK